MIVRVTLGNFRYLLECARLLKSNDAHTTSAFTVDITLHLTGQRLRCFVSIDPDNLEIVAWEVNTICRLTDIFPAFDSVDEDYRRRRRARGVKYLLHRPTPHQGGNCASRGGRGEFGELYTSHLRRN